MTKRNCTAQNPPKQAKRKKQKYTTESFISRATEKHNGYYKYDKVVCSKSTDIVEIYCPNCDAYFKQRAYCHVYGQGCGLCYRKRVGDLTRSSAKEFIEKARKVHDKKYDYSLVVYTRNNVKVKIICNQCKATFAQTPNGHLLGQGCAECGGSKRLTTKQFIEKSESIHGKGAYDYSLVDYKRSLSKISVICPTHGIFQTKPNWMLSGRGCPTCGRIRASVNNRLSFKAFLKRSNLKHENRYTYDASSYKDTDSMVLIHCESHGSFKQRAADHMAGHGCKRCNMNLNGFGRSNFVDICNKKDGQGVLYVIKCYKGSEVFYKVGITSQKVKSRFNANFPYSYDVVFSIKEDAAYIYDLENKIHALLKDHHYSPEIDFKGSVYECFTHITKPVEKLLKQLESTEQLQLLA